MDERAKEQQTTELAMMKLEAEADAWLAENPDMGEAVREVANCLPRRFQDRGAAQIDALLRLTFMGAFYRGLKAHEAHADALRATGAGRAEAEASVLPIAMAFLDYAAGEGLEWVEDAERGTPKMDAADLYCEIARRLGHKIDAPEMLALTEAGHQAIRALPAQTAGGAGD